MNELARGLLKVRALARAGDVDGLMAELENPLEIGGIATRGRAADYLAQLGAKQAVPRLVELLRKDPHDGVRTHAVRALGEIGTADVVGPVRSALEDRSDAVRSWAAHHLGELGDIGAVPKLIALLDDDDWALRRTTAEALAKLGDPKAVEPLNAARARERFIRRRHITRALRALAK